MALLAFAVLMAVRTEMVYRVRTRRCGEIDRHWAEMTRRGVCLAANPYQTDDYGRWTYAEMTLSLSRWTYRSFFPLTVLECHGRLHAT
jgi:hypothetical protein